MSVSPSHSGPLYAGTSLSITCTVTLDSSVNNDETVSVEWSIVSAGRFSNSSTTREPGGSYVTNLTISPLAEADDGTTVICTGTIYGAAETKSATGDATIYVSGT